MYMINVLRCNIQDGFNLQFYPTYELVYLYPSSRLPSSSPSRFQIPRYAYESPPCIPVHSFQITRLGLISRAPGIHYSTGSCKPTRLTYVDKVRWDRSRVGVRGGLRVRLWRISPMASCSARMGYNLFCFALLMLSSCTLLCHGN